MSSHDVTVTGYALVLAFAVGLQIAALRPSSSVVSLQQVFGRLMRTRSGRIGVLAAWAWLGLHFLAL